MRTRWLSSPALRRATDRGEGLTAREVSIAATGTHSVFSTGSTSRNQPTAPRSATMSPTTLTTTCVTNPAAKSVSPNAVTIGQGVGAGTSIRFCASTDIISSTADDVHDSENYHPYAMDEVPVPGDHLDVLGIVSSHNTAKTQAKNQNK